MTEPLEDSDEVELALSVDTELDVPVAETVAELVVTTLDVEALDAELEVEVLETDDEVEDVTS